MGEELYRAVLAWERAQGELCAALARLFPAGTPLTLDLGSAAAPRLVPAEVVAPVVTADVARALALTVRLPGSGGRLATIPLALLMERAARVAVDPS